MYGPKWVPAALPMRLLAPGLILMGLRVGIGSIYYTKDHPSFDLYLHGTRLILIVAVVSVTAALGLGAVSSGMSAVEGAISIAGQWMACLLIGLGIGGLFEASVPAVWLTMMCGVATLAGKSLAFAMDLHGAALIALVIVPPAIVFAWREARDMRAMVSQAFGSGKVAPIDLSQESA